MTSDPNQIGMNTPLPNENPPSSPKKEKRAIALAPLRRLMRSEGVKLVSTDALEFLRDKLEEKAIEIVKKTVRIVNAEQRKRIQADDIAVTVLIG